MVVGCTDHSSRAAKPDSTTTEPDSIAAWARAIDGAADSTHAREFDFPSRSTEGGKGRFYQLADSAVRVDIDDFGEMGKRRERFYARGTALRLTVRIEERYDQPMSGNVVKSVVDSTWFLADTASRWRDSLGVVRARPDSALGIHGREVFAEYLWAIRAARSGGRS
jgi:hypothetical protein